MTVQTAVCPRVVGSADGGRTMVLCGQALPCAHHSTRGRRSDELARAICAAQRRLNPPGTTTYDGEPVEHDTYFGLQACPDCIHLAGLVEDELNPTPRLR